MENSYLIGYIKGLMNMASSMSTAIGPSYVTVKYYTKAEYEVLIKRKQINIYESEKSLEDIFNAWFGDKKISESLLYWMGFYLDKPLHIYESDSHFTDTLMDQEATTHSFIEDVYLIEYKEFIMCLVLGNNE
jgi:hypothetical protein